MDQYANYEERLYKIIDLFELNKEIPKIFCSAPHFAYSSAINNGQIIEETTFLGRILK